MIYEVVKKLEADGNLNLLVRSGLVSPKVRFYFELYTKYKHYMELGMNSRQAVIQVSIIVNVNERTIWRAIKAMRLHDKGKES